MSIVESDARVRWDTIKFVKGESLELRNGRVWGQVIDGGLGAEVVSGRGRRWRQSVASGECVRSVLWRGALSRC